LMNIAHPANKEMLEKEIIKRFGSNQYYRS
jgi:hypothetical protein